ncbi:MAG: type II toxin-antitoxin system HicB family antitoxin [Oligoflexia bacterium]|nr:type II toxin-antitoxin system HicB family antitoxin [Oligoflexia bacterium]
MNLTAIIWKEDDLFVAKCAELGVASQGKTEKEALNNLKEAVELYLEDTPARAIIKPEIKKFKVAV